MASTMAQIAPTPQAAAQQAPELALSGGRFALLLGAALAVTTAYGVTLPVLPAMLERLLPGAPQLVAAHTGWITAAYTLALFAFAPLWGGLSDRVDRRVVLALGLVGSGAALWALDFSSELRTLYAARIAAGVLSAAVLPAVFAWIVQGSPPQQRQRRFAWVATATALGFLLGPAVGNLLQDMAGAAGSGSVMADSPLALVAALCVAAAAAVYRLPACRGQAGAPSASETTDAAAICRALLLTAAVVLAITVAEVGLTLISRGVGVVRPTAVARYFALCSASMVAVQMCAYSVLERWLGEPRLVRLCVVALAIGVAALAWPVAAWVPALSFLLTGSAVGVLIPALAARISAVAGARQGWALGWQSGAANLGQAAGAAASGTLYALTPGLPFIAAAAALAAAALVTATPRAR